MIHKYVIMSQHVTSLMWSPLSVSLQYLRGRLAKTVWVPYWDDKLSFLLKSCRKVLNLNWWTVLITVYWDFSLNHIKISYPSLLSIHPKSMWCCTTENDNCTYTYMTHFRTQPIMFRLQLSQFAGLNSVIALISVDLSNNAQFPKCHTLSVLFHLLRTPKLSNFHSGPISRTKKYFLRLGMFRHPWKLLGYYLSWNAGSDL